MGSRGACFSFRANASGDGGNVSDVAMLSLLRRTASSGVGLAAAVTEDQ